MKIKRFGLLKAVTTVAGLSVAIILQLGLKAGATGINITGTVNDPTNAHVNGGYVYATTPGSSTPLYGPVTTNAYGSYTLTVGASGTYDIHFDPAPNTGFSSVVDSSISVTGALTLNAQLTSTTYTLSGTLTDSSNNALAGITVRLNKSTNNGTNYQTTTDPYGNYSLSVPASYYYLYLTGSMTGIPNFTLTQSNYSSINLMGSNQTLNLVIHTATVTASAYNNAGQQEPSPTIYSRATSGTTLLYPGDPGTSINVANSTGVASGNTVVITTIMGATYAASGLESSSYTTSICATISGTTSYYDCLRLPLVVTGNVSVNVPVTSPATRTFSGQLTDSGGAPVSNAQVQLIKYGDPSTVATTNANGNFSMQVMPKKYYLKVSGGSLNGMQSYTLTQSSSNPSIDLTGSDVTQNLQINTATLTVTAKDSSGNPDYNSSVIASSSSGTATLYTGDPGETVSITSQGFSTTSTNNVGTIGTIVGATYNANGLNTTSTNGSICDGATSPYWNCLTTAYTVSGNASINVPQ